jgi:mannose/fructose-specific phosphotransferase system component IIA
VLRPDGQRLLRLTNAVAGQMPEIAAFNVQKGTEPTLAYLADLFRRRLGPDGTAASEAADAAEAFLDLVVGGPANLAARGVALDDTEVDRHTRYTVGLFLRGVMPRDRKSTAQKEIQQVMNSIAEALALLDEARERLNQLEKLN